MVVSPVMTTCMAVFEFTKEDVGKAVLNADGEKVGLIVDTRGGKAYVEPEPNVADTIMAKLGWADRDDDTYELTGNGVDEPVAKVTDDAVHLRTL